LRTAVRSQVRQRAAPGVEACGVVPNLHKSFLDYVFCARGVAEDAQSDAVRQGRVPVIELREGVLTTGHQRGGQVRVG